MAFTVSAPVGNKIDLAEKFLPVLDEVYRYAAVSTILDTDADKIKWTGANTYNLFTVSTTGLGNYSRNNGYVPGDANGTWEPYKINVDRGRSYMVDAMDDEETLGMAFGSLAGSIIKNEVAPETDAYRFATYAGTAGILKATPFAIGDDTNLAAMIDKAQAEMDDEEVPAEGRILFVSPKAYAQLKNNIVRTTMNKDGNVDYNIEMYNDLRIVKVPQKRFYTQVTLNTASNSEDMGGYTVGGAPINFMIIHPSAVSQVVKHAVPKIFSPEVNQDADAWKFNYRIYHDAIVTKAKAKGIYLAAGVQG